VRHAEFDGHVGWIHAEILEADTVAGRVNENLGRHSLPVRGGVVAIRASVGVAVARCDADTDPMTLIRQADEAMYEAKRAARSARDQLAGSHP
jgi:GGDEF domain-containing protein